MSRMTHRCDWAKNTLAVENHDNEWGVPLHDDRKLFELLILEGAQAGLSWDAILAKRDNYRKAFDNFDVQSIANYNSTKCSSLLQDAGIIRNRLKIASTVQNAKSFITIQQEFGSFDTYLWNFVDNKPIVNKWVHTQDIPASNDLSDTLSRDLKKRGFSFVGTTIIYAYLQATGVINDHVINCFRYTEVNAP